VWPRPLGHERARARVCVRYDWATCVRACVCVRYHWVTRERARVCVSATTGPRACARVCVSATTGHVRARVRACVRACVCVGACVLTTTGPCVCRLPYFACRPSFSSPEAAAASLQEATMRAARRSVSAEG
jgi:hypothetical protein